MSHYRSRNRSVALVERVPNPSVARAYRTPNPSVALVERVPNPSISQGYRIQIDNVYGAGADTNAEREENASELQAASAGSNEEAMQLRPRGPPWTSTDGSMTILENIWGELFNENSGAITRLGQFLRGIAVHLIEDYEPKHSLVVTPSKMQQYYQDTKVTNEIYPWQIIFDDRTSSISRMLRELGVQHHLFQDKVIERPDTPGLTIRGFETWATLLIRAHPEQELERLVKAAMNMSIDSADNEKQRLPEELTRWLFPQQADTAIAERLQKAMSVHCNLILTTRTESTPGAVSQKDDTKPQAEPKSPQESAGSAE